MDSFADPLCLYIILIFYIMEVSLDFDLELSSKESDGGARAMLLSSYL